MVDVKKRENLETLIEPIDIPYFFSYIWEQKPISVDKRNNHSLLQLFSLEEFDRIVSLTNLRYPLFRLFRDGVLLPPDQCTTSRQVGYEVDANLADLNTIYEHFSDGGTIVLQSLQKVSTPISKFCISLEKIFKHPVQCYAYLTPPGASGPPAHYDTHDVFVYQIAGNKKWDIWGNPVSLPMRLVENTYDHSAIESYAKNSKPTINTTLKEGGYLYIPRGFVHHARTVDSLSLHLSFSVMGIRKIDLLRRAAAQAMESLTTNKEAQSAIKIRRKLGDSIDYLDKIKIQNCMEEIFSDLHKTDWKEIHSHEFNRQRHTSSSGELMRRIKNP